MKRGGDGRVEDEKEAREVVVVVVVEREKCSCTRLFPRQSVTSPFDANNQPTREERVGRGPTARPIVVLGLLRPPPAPLVSFRSAVSRINSLEEWWWWWVRT